MSKWSWNWQEAVKTFQFHDREWSYFNYLSQSVSYWIFFPNDILIILRGVIWFWKNSFSAINRMRQEKKDRIMIMFWKKRNFQNEQTKFGQLSKWPALRKVNPILCLLFSCELIQYFVQDFIWKNSLNRIYNHLRAYIKISIFRIYDTNSISQLTGYPKKSKDFLQNLQFCQGYLVP